MSIPLHKVTYRYAYLLYSTSIKIVAIMNRRCHDANRFVKTNRSDSHTVWIV